MKIVFNDENHTSRTSAVDFDVTPGGALQECVWTSMVFCMSVFWGTVQFKSFDVRRHHVRFVLNC